MLSQAYQSARKCEYTFQIEKAKIMFSDVFFHIKLL